MHGQRYATHATPSMTERFSFFISQRLDRASVGASASSADFHPLIPYTCVSECINNRTEPVKQTAAKSAGPRSDAFCRAPPVQAHIMDTTDAHRLTHDDDAHLYSCEEYSRALASDLSLENARNLLKRQAGLRSNRRASPEARRSCRDSSSEADARKASVSPASHVVNWLVDRAKRHATFRSAQTPTPDGKSPPTQCILRVRISRAISNDHNKEKQMWKMS